MNTLRNFWQTITGQAPAPAASGAALREAPAAPPAGAVMALDFAPNDPLIAYFQSQPQPVEIDRLNLDSPALRRLRASDVKLVVPLVSQGELIGLLNLGARRSEQEYTSEDRGLLANLSTQASPAVRVAQLVRQQRIEAQARERLEQELRVARLIQQTLLPQKLPQLSGWQLAAYYQPARAVGGDFYDFIHLPDGRLGLVVGDVTDKGVPAALVMATTRANLRAAALRFDSPGQVLAHVNDVLVPDIPAKMFVTCLYAILDPATGRLHYANAGHDVAYCWAAGQVAELRARGMPLGLMEGMAYEEKERTLAPGETVIFYSDGLVEAHSPQRDMFGFPRLAQLLEAHPGGAGVIEFLLKHLSAFTGPHWEQEDDTTMVVLQREAGAGSWEPVATFEIASEPGNEREAMRRLAEAVAGLHLPAAQLEKLKTAVAEGAMNAIEHGNQNRADLAVGVTVLLSSDRGRLAVRIRDHALSGGGRGQAPETPDINAKLAGLQTPRGWGLFLIEKMVDRVNVIESAGQHTLELIVNLQGDSHDR